MRSLTWLLVYACIVTPVYATTLIGNNPDVNGGGLATTPPGVSWTKVGVGDSAVLEDDRGGPDGGDWLVGGYSPYDECSPVYENYYAQGFAPPSGPGFYDVELSGWLNAFASWHD